jgi:hypothetical protein
MSSTRKYFVLTSVSKACLAITVSGLLYVPTASAVVESKEVVTLKSLSPFIATWKSAIVKKNVTAAKQAAEKYEAKWQGLEVYVNHRSLPLYRDMEVDTQFAMEDELEKNAPDFTLLTKKITHLKDDLDGAIQMAKSGPALGSLFEDLTTLRDLRAKTLYATRTALAPETLDVASAKVNFNAFKSGFPSVAPLIEVRSESAVDDIQASLEAANSVFSNAASTPEQLATANVNVINSYAFGVNLVNAAARTSNLMKLAINDADKKNLTQLNVIQLELEKNVLTAGETGSSSNFSKLQSPLESLGRNINSVGTLRTALVSYDSVAKASPQDAEKVKAAKKLALQAVAVTQQALVGQFWGSAELKTFLDSLPKF